MLESVPVESLTIATSLCILIRRVECNFMEFVTNDFRIGADACRMEYVKFESNDGAVWKLTFDSWRQLKIAMREYRAREPNIPEGLTEAAFCLWSGSVRKIKITGGQGSFDTFSLVTKRKEQIKACSVESDLTSFGPNSVWDDLYFLDFYQNGAVDGKFDVFLIESSLIYSRRITARKTFREIQAEGKRPRFSLKELIEEESLVPLETSVQVW